MANINHPHIIKILEGKNRLEYSTQLYKIIKKISL